MKVRVRQRFEHPDDVSVVHFNWTKKAESESDKDFMDRMTTNHEAHSASWQGVQYVDIDEVELPSRDTRDQWMPDFAQANGVKIDADWSQKLMPARVVLKKERERLQSEIDAELERPIPDAVEIMRKQRGLDKIREINASEDLEAEVYHMALQGLDARVAGGEPDKPQIRAKLQAKIAELQGGGN